MLVHVQVLRFFAAVAVVAFHALGAAPDGFKVGESAISFVLSYGGRGVDLFFVISGFIIFYATRSSALTPAEFLRRRLERIVPLYFFVIFAVTILAITLPATFGAPDWYTPRHILKSLAFIAFTDGEMPVVYVGWSLEYEMYFYLAVALLMALTRDVWRNTVLMFSALVTVGRIAGVDAVLGHYAFLTDPMLLEFVFGVIVGGVFVDGRVGWPGRGRGLCHCSGADGRSRQPRHCIRHPVGRFGGGRGLSQPEADRSIMAGARHGAARGRVLFDLSGAGGDGVAGGPVDRGVGSSHSAFAAGDGHHWHRRGRRFAAQHPRRTPVAETQPPPDIVRGTPAAIIRADDLNVCGPRALAPHTEDTQ